MEKSPEELKQLLDELQQAYNKLGEINPFRGFTVKSIEDSTKEIKKVEEALNKATQKVGRMQSGAEGLEGAFRAIKNEISRQSEGLRLSNQVYGNFAKLTNKVALDQAGITRLSLKELDSIESKVNTNLKLLNQSENLLANEREMLQNQISQEENKRFLYEQDKRNLYNLKNQLEKVKTAEKAIQINKQEGFSLEKETIKLAKTRLEQEKKINKSLGTAPQLLEGVSKQLKKLGIPDLGISESIEETKESLRESNKEAGPGSALATFGGNLSKNFGKLVNRANIFQALLSFIIDGAFKADSQITNMQRSLSLSTEEATALRIELGNVAMNSGEAAITGTKLATALGNMNQKLGLQGKINSENLKAQVRLTELMGISAESATTLQFYSEATGKNLENQKLQSLEATSQISSQYGVQLNQKQILEEVGQASAFTLAQFKGSVSALAEGTAQAKALGTSLEDVNAASQQFLDFSSSITKELEAELLLGRNINLERARLAALNNDMSTVMDEITSQMGDFNEFTNLNRIQQEALANSLGMSTKKLSDMLLLRQYEGNTQQEITAMAGEDVAQRVQQLTLQQEFNNAVLKLKEVFVDLAPALIPAMRVLGDMLSQVALIVDILGPFMGTIMGAIGGFAVGGPWGALVGGILGAGSDTYRFASDSNRVKTPTQTSDLISTSDGKTTVSTKEGGLYELADNDDLIATPNISKTVNQNVQTEPQKITVQNNNQETNKILKQILNKQNSIKMDSTKVGTAFSVNNYEIQ